MTSRSLFKGKESYKLDIACGADKMGPDWIGMDIQKLPGVDIVHDVEKYPWPLPDQRFSCAIASHIIEHLNPLNFGIFKFMDEIWRVLKFDGELAIMTPYAGSYGFWQDPTHIKGFNEASFYYFDPLHPSGFYRLYKPKPWRIKETIFHKDGNLEIVLIKRREDKSYAQKDV